MATPHQSTLNEIATITASLSRIQAHAQNSQEEILTLRERVNDLQREAETTERHVEEKDVAIRKLEHVRNALRGLLGEITLESVEKVGVSQGGLLEGATQTQEDASDSDGTVHQRVPRQKAPSRVPSSLEANHRQSEDTPMREAKIKPDPAANSVQGTSKTTSPRSPREPAESSNSSFHINAPHRPAPNETDQDVWKLHYNRPPVASKHLSGAYSWGDLQYRLQLDEETMSTLESLELMPDHGLRVYIHKDIAFVYDPINLESPSASFLIDWGRKRANKRIGSHITHGRPSNPVFHTFLFPVKKNSWYYVGAHSWILANLGKVWSTLGDNSKRTLTRKLQERCGGEEEDIVRMLDEGELQQFCVEVVHRSHEVRSREFVAIRMGYGVAEKTEG